MAFAGVAEDHVTMLIKAWNFINMEMNLFDWVVETERRNCVNLKMFDKS